MSEIGCRIGFWQQLVCTHSVLADLCKPGDHLLDRYLSSGAAAPGICQHLPVLYCLALCLRDWKPEVGHQPICALQLLSVGSFESEVSAVATEQSFVADRHGYLCVTAELFNSSRAVNVPGYGCSVS